jgi:hypothetical protein
MQQQRHNLHNIHAHHIRHLRFAKSSKNIMVRINLWNDYEAMCDKEVLFTEKMQEGLIFEWNARVFASSGE